METSINRKPNELNVAIILSEKNRNGTEGAYNPFEHRDMEHSYSTAGSLAHLFNGFLGSGILAMPMAFKNSGLLLGSVGTLLLSLLCTHCFYILVKTSHDLCKKAKIPSLDFAETAEKAFELGPAATRKYSRFVRLLCDYGMSTANLGTSCIFIIFAGTTFRDMLNFTLEIDLDVRLYIIVMLLPCICIGQIRKLKYLVPFSALGILSIVITFSITLYYVFEGPLEISECRMVSSWNQIPLFFGTVLFAMEGIGGVMPIENSMREPQHFLGCPGVLNTVMVIIPVLYGGIGFFGYVRYGDEIKGSITMNLPEGVLLAQVAQLFIALALLFSFGVVYYIPTDILWRKIAPKISKEQHNRAQILFRAGLILILGGFAVVVPKLEPFIGLVGAGLLSMLGLFMPAVVETVYLYPDAFGPGNWKLYKNILIAIFSIFALLSGSFVSILEIIDMYST